jgi:hypothetical protein
MVIDLGLLVGDDSWEMESLPKLIVGCGASGLTLGCTRRR